MPWERKEGGIGRELFSAPRDTRPLPALRFVAPPLEPLALLRPIPSSGPRPALYGNFLRQKKELRLDTSLFLNDQNVEGSAGTGDQFVVDAELDESLLTPEERQARLASYKANYDSLNLGNLHFGQIYNRNRFSLSERPDEPIEFIEVNPATGLERWPGQAPIVYDRERVQDFAFADNLENRLELARLEYAGTITQGKYLAALEFATECFTKRFQTPRALEIAVEIYSKASAMNEDDPTAELGLAACAEANFDFEKAFQIYEGLIAGSYANHPLVLARLARLQARFRLTARARRNFEAAERYGRTEWIVQWHYGNFLLEQGDVDGAIMHLELASQFEPTAAEFQSVRATIRTDLGNALVAGGEIDKARGLYTRALQADESEQRATAGLLNISYLSGGDDVGPEVSGEDGAGFDLLIAQGLLALQAGELQTARDQFSLAAVADPLRAYEAWRALSYLAEITGNDAEALEYIDQAESNNPRDVYSLFQRGRILAQNDDTTGALESLTKALDIELELPDALAAIGRIEMLSGNYENAERYLERAVSIDGRLVEAVTLRGLNALFMNRPVVAQENFERALQLDGEDPVASIGQAWCAYSMGDPTEAKTLLREFGDSRRSRGEEDPYRVYASEQIDRIGTWQEKVVWNDAFERQDLRNGWKVDEVPDSKLLLREGKVAIEGSFDKAGRSRLKRFYTSGDFVSIEAELTINATNTSRVGIFVALEQKRGSRSANQTTAEVTLSRHPQDKKIQYRSMRRGREEDEYVDSEIMQWLDGQSVTLRLERFGESAKTAFRVSIDGVPIAERVPMPSLGATTREIVVGVFAEGEPGRTVSVEVDNIEIVKKER